MLNKHEKKENKLTNAQITHDASFGPVVIIATFYVMYSVSYNLYVLISINKTKKDRRKLTNNPNDTPLACIIWACDGDTCSGLVAVVGGGNVWWWCSGWWWPFIITVLYMVV